MSWLSLFARDLSGRCLDGSDPLQLDQAFSYMGITGGVVCRHYDRRGSEWQYWFKSWSFLTPTESTGQLTKVVNPLGETVQYYHNDSRNPAATPPSGAPDNWYAPHRHEVTARINALGKQWDFAYAPLGSATVSASALQRGNLATADDPLDNLWTFGYDGLNNLTSVYEPEGTAGTSDDILTTIAYESSIDPTVPTSVTLPPDAEDQTGTILLEYWDDETYDGRANGKLKRVTDANGVETAFRYHLNGLLGRIDEGPDTAAGSWWKVFTLFADVDAVGRVKRSIRFGKEVSIVEGAIETEQPCPPFVPCRLYGSYTPPDECCCPTGSTCVCVFEVYPGCPYPSGGETTVIDPNTVVGGYEIPLVCPALNIVGDLDGSVSFVRDAMSRVTQANVSGGDGSMSATLSMTQTIDYDGLGRPTLSQLFTDEPRGGEGGGPGITRTFTYGYNDLAGTFARTGPDGLVTTAQTDIAGRVLWTSREGLTALYAYYANGQVQSVTYNNGTVVSYEYDDAERLKAIHHLNPGAPESVILELAYGYNPSGLITSITETAPGEPTAVTTFEYDRRGRLLEEERAGSHPYHLAYTYDQGGNRKTKVDHVNGYLTQYHYDTDPDTEWVDCDGDGALDRPAKDCYHTRNNRLMYSETFPDYGNLPRIEKVWYEYEASGPAVGNPTYIVRQVYHANPFDPPDNYGYVLKYNSSGELWFISKQTWTGSACPPGSPVTQSIHEFRTFGRNMRLTRERDPSAPQVALPGTTQWHDFDGDEAYFDSSVAVGANGGPISFTPLFAREPGIGVKDMQTGNTSYLHGDQIGSLRAVTDTPGSGNASVTGRIVYTAFGERVSSDGSISTRHQYAGEWGYDTSDAYASGMSPHFGGEPGDEVPFIHIGHRWYDPASGRFVQRDPIGIAGGLNVYVYARNNAVLLTDPEGLAPAFFKSKKTKAIGVYLCLAAGGLAFVSPPASAVVGTVGVALVGGEDAIDGSCEIVIDSLTGWFFLYRSIFIDAPNEIRQLEDHVIKKVTPGPDI